MNATIQETPTTEPSKFFCPENYFTVKPEAPALQHGVLGIHLQRIDCLLETARREIDNDEKIIALVLIETAQNLVEQVEALVRHDEMTKIQAQKLQTAAQAQEV